jgi:DGQHR domain-containing protein
MAGFAISAAVLKQQGRELYCFGMSSEQLAQICYVTPRSRDDPDEIQRIVDPKRAKAIGEYIKGPTSLLPNSIVVSLTTEVQIADGGSMGVKVLHFPAEEGKFAYVLDGQHRLEGFKYSDGIKYDLPVVAIYNADETLRGKIFADINSNQVKVSDVHLLSLYYQIKELPVDQASVMDVITKLNEDQDSPLKGRIKVMDSDKGWWVTNSGLKKWLSAHLVSGGVLATKTPAEQAQVIKEYFHAISRIWPEAWKNRKDYNLVRPIGMEVIIGVFPTVKHRCDLNAGRQYTSDNFEAQMEPLKDAEIDLPGGGKLLMDWQRGPMGIFSNAATRTLITRRLADIVRRADEDDETVSHN